MDDLISRQAAIDAVKRNAFRLTVAEEQNSEGHVAWSAYAVYTDVLEGALLELPSAQPERDIPIKPIEATDRAWGIPHKQAVCPKCDYYLGHVAFFDTYKGKRITYCESCGQAIDWEGWDFDE